MLHNLLPGRGLGVTPSKLMAFGLGGSIVATVSEVGRVVVSIISHIKTYMTVEST